MSEATRQTFVLEIDSGSQPISGRLTEERRGSIEFGGWMGLASALERLLERPRRDQLLESTEEKKR